MPQSVVPRASFVLIFVSPRSSAVVVVPSVVVAVSGCASVACGLVWVARVGGNHARVCVGGKHARACGVAEGRDAPVAALHSGVAPVFWVYPTYTRPEGRGGVRGGGGGFRGIPGWLGLSQKA